MQVAQWAHTLYVPLSVSVKKYIINHISRHIIGSEMILQRCKSEGGLIVNVKLHFFIFVLFCFCLYHSKEGLAGTNVSTPTFGITLTIEYNL